MDCTASLNPLDASQLRAVEASRPKFDGRLGFGLFLLLNAILFIRPSEVIGSLNAVPIYQVVMAACVIASLPALMSQLSPARIAARPGTACVIAIMLAIALSHLRHHNVYGARIGVAEFFKIVCYFLLLVGLVDSPARLRTFLKAVALFIFFIAMLAVLEYHGALRLQTLQAMEQRIVVDEVGEPGVFHRLRATGIFSDPNDFSLALVTGLLVLAHLALEQRTWPRRLWYLVPMLLLAHAFALTQSRGGFLAMMAGAATYIFARWGWRRAMLLWVVMPSALLIAFAGRQTSINLEDPEDTGQQRLLLWRDGLQMVKRAPVFGVGYNEFAGETGMVAHNSYVHCFAELGMLGGTLFVGAVFLPLMSLRRIGKARGDEVPEDLASWQPCLLAVLLAYMVGMCSLTQSYALQTYLVLGVAGAYCNLVVANAPSMAIECSLRLFARVCAIGIGVLLMFNIFVRVLVR